MHIHEGRCKVDVGEGLKMWIKGEQGREFIEILYEGGYIHIIFV